MSCIPGHYRWAVDRIQEYFSWAVDLFEPLLGRPFAVAAVLILMAPAAAIFIYGSRVLIPRFMRLYYEESIEEKARHYWRRKCVGTGMTQKGAKLSIAMGVMFYFLLRIMVALPMYYSYTLPGFAAAFLSVTLLGFYCAGKVPDKPSAWWRYCRKFQAPTMTGMGLGVATIILDFVIQVGILTVNYMNSA